MSARGWTAAVLLAVTAAIAIGCGGGGNVPAPATTTASPPDGRTVFVSAGCASCHVLAAAGASGRVGPDLDHLRPDVATVTRQVTNGGGRMPKFGGTLSTAEIRAVARYVADMAGDR